MRDEEKQNDKKRKKEFFGCSCHDGFAHTTQLIPSPSYSMPCCNQIDNLSVVELNRFMQIAELAYRFKYTNMPFESVEMKTTNFRCVYTTDYAQYIRGADTCESVKT